MEDHRAEDRVISRPIIKLADTLFETFSLKQLYLRRDVLLGLRSHNPKIAKLKVFSAVHLALLWKETEEIRQYRLH